MMNESCYRAACNYATAAYAGAVTAPTEPWESADQRDRAVSRMADAIKVRLPHASMVDAVEIAAARYAIKTAT